MCVSFGCGHDRYDNCHRQFNIQIATYHAALVDQMLVSKAFADQLETFDTRAEHLRQFLIKINPNIAYDLIALTDVCGPTASDGKITALVVSRESLPGSQTS